MFFTAISSALFFAPLVASVAVPSTDIAARSAQAGAVLSAQHQCEAKDGSYYLLCLNLWGESSGEQACMISVLVIVTINSCFGIVANRPYASFE
jgi:hypothetical protein